jgi:hypothetical protein
MTSLNYNANYDDMKNDKQSEQEIASKRDAALARALTTPHKPHKPLKKAAKKAKKPAK